MSRWMSLRRVSTLLALSVGVWAIAMNATSAASTPRRGRIGPNQAFIGLVNGSPGIGTPAQILVACPGPIFPGETTHPLAGQHLEVQPPPPVGTAFGDTGPDGNRVTAYLGIPPAASATAGGLATFTHYGSPRPIPTTITVPCAGSGFVTFMPWPRDPPLARLRRPRRVREHRGVAPPRFRLGLAPRTRWP